MRKKIQKELKNGETVENICKKYNITFSQLFDIMNLNTSKYIPKNNAKNISKTGNKYHITKIINGKREYFGQYKTMQDAILVRDELKKCNWDKTKLQSIKTRTGVILKCLGNTHIQENSKGNWNIHKVIDNRKINYGTYNTLQEAKQVRDELVLCDWDKTQLDRIVKELRVHRIYRGGQPRVKL